MLFEFPSVKTVSSIGSLARWCFVFLCQKTITELNMRFGPLFTMVLCMNVIFFFEFSMRFMLVIDINVWDIYIMCMCTVMRKEKKIYKQEFILKKLTRTLHFQVYDEKYWIHRQTHSEERRKQTKTKKNHQKYKKKTKSEPNQMNSKKTNRQSNQYNIIIIMFYPPYLAI